MEYEYRGYKGTLTDICQYLDKNPNLVRSRLKAGWDLERAVTEKGRQKGNTWADYQEYLNGYRSNGHTNYVRNK